jgi:hypothetical protein
VRLFRAPGVCPLISGQCGSTIVVTREGGVTLTDSEGDQNTTLTANELAEFVALIDSPLSGELFQASAWSCAPILDLELDLELTDAAGEVHRFENAAGCLMGGSPGAGLPLNRLRYFMDRVHYAGRRCPGDAGVPSSLAEPVEGRGLCL